MDPNQYPQQKSNNTVLWVVLGILGVGSCGCVAVMGAILFPVFNQAKQAATKTLALSNAKRTALATIIYSADYDDKLPLAKNWMDSTYPYAKTWDIYKAPLFRKTDPSAYGLAFRSELAGKKSFEIDEIRRWAMIFDSTNISKNASTKLDTLPSPGRYGTGSSASNTIAFADGHARAIRDENLHAVGADGKPEIR